CPPRLPPLALRRPPPRPALFPYTTLFRSAPLDPAPQRVERDAGGDASAEESRDDPQHVRHRIYLQHRSAWQAERDSSTTVRRPRSEEHTSELQSLAYLVCRLLLEKKNT